MRRGGSEIKTPRPFTCATPTVLNFFAFLARPALTGEAKVLHASGVKTARHCLCAPSSIFTFAFSLGHLRYACRDILWWEFTNEQ